MDSAIATPAKENIKPKSRSDERLVCATEEAVPPPGTGISELDNIINPPAFHPFRKFRLHNSKKL